MNYRDALVTGLAFTLGCTPSGNGSSLSEGGTSGSDGAAVDRLVEAAAGPDDATLLDVALDSLTYETCNLGGKCLAAGSPAAAACGNVLYYGCNPGRICCSYEGFDSGPQCDVGLTMCSGSCVDTTSDLRHCGGCFKDCTGYRGGCEAGVCQPAPVTVANASAYASPGPIVTDGTNVYWTSPGLELDSNAGAQITPGAVFQALVDGGPALILAIEQRATSGVTLNIRVGGGDVYWTVTYDSGDAAGSRGAVKRVPIGGGATEVVDSDPIFYRGLAVDPTHAYWSTLDAVVAFEHDAGRATPLLSLPQDADIGFSGSEIAVDTANLYWGNNTVDPYILVKAPLDGGAPMTIAQSSFGIYSITTDGTSVFWRNARYLARVNAAPQSPTKVELTFDGGTPSVIFSQLSGPYLIDSGNLYAWTSAGLMRRALDGDGGADVILAPGSANGMAIDAKNVYWTTGDAILKVTK